MYLIGKFPAPLYQNEDGSGNPSPVVDETVVQPEPVQEVAPVIEQTEVTQETARKEPPPKWALDRISEETRKRQDADQRAQAAERRAAEAEALASRIQSGETSSQSVPTNIQQDQPEFKTAVQQAAAAQRFHEETLKVRSAGFTQYGASFQESLQVLSALGATSDDFVSDVLAVDKSNAHILLETLAKDPERAVALTNMDSRSRIAELTRLTMANTAKKPDIITETNPAPVRQVSKAPAPAPIVQPSATKTIDGYADEATDEQFTAQFNARMKERTARR